MAAIVLGDVVKPIGLGGDVKLRQAPDFWEAALTSRRLQLVQGDRVRAVHVQRVQSLGNGMQRLRFDEIADRDASEAAVGGQLVLSLPDDDIAPPPEPRPFQLEGSRVELLDGTFVGTVVGMQQMPAQTLLVVECDGRRCLVPNVAPIVSNVDVEARLVQIDPPDGLLEL